MAENTKKRAPKELSYEEAFAELEEIVELLESGDLELEKAMEHFERGQALAERCSGLLDEAELKLTQLVPDESGDYREQEFDEEDA